MPSEPYVSSDNNYDYRISLDLESIRSRVSSGNRKKDYEMERQDEAKYQDGNFVAAQPNSQDFRNHSPSEDESDNKQPKKIIAYITVSVLCLINLLNYMDRYTVAGVLKDIQSFYNLKNTEGGFLQTCFIVSYMIMAPVFGYLGDRFCRKYIIAGGVLFWSVTTLMGSFVPKDLPFLFFILRALVGVGEASYSTIAPTVIADLFSNALRTKMLAIFYFAIPVGSGLGFIAGSEVAKAFSDWRWALRVTPPLGVLSVILMMLIVKEPARGEAEGGSSHLKSTNIKDDLLDLSRNKSFVWSTLGFTCVTFAAGSLAWWAPTYMIYAIEARGDQADTDHVSIIFGVITCLAGISGVLLGSVGAQYYRKYNSRADPLVCAVGLLLSVPFAYISIVSASRYENLSWVMIFFAETFLSMNWPIVADMLLYVVIPTRRSMAEAVQILASHAFGDASSPYIIGAVSDAIIAQRGDTTTSRYIALQYGLYIAAFVMVLGSLCFLVNAWYILDDKERCTALTQGRSPSHQSLSGNEHDIPSILQEGDEESPHLFGYTDTQNLIS